MGQRLSVLYIAGAGRSGSTLLAAALGQASDVFAAGEIRHLLSHGYLDLPDDVLCGCGAPFADCLTWKRIAAVYSTQDGTVAPSRLASISHKVDRLRYLPLIVAPVSATALRRRFSVFRDALLALYRSVQLASGARTVLDSSKDLSLLYILSRIPDLDLRVVHLVRDSRGVAHSRTRKRRRTEFLREEKYLLQRSIFKSAGDWWYRNLGIEALRLTKVPYRRIRYEDFVRNPRQTLVSILRWLGSEDEADYLRDDRLLLRALDHQAFGNPSRFATSPVEVRADIAWLEKMPAARRLTVSFLTWPLLYRYGYLGSRARSD